VRWRTDRVPASGYNQGMRRRPGEQTQADGSTLAAACWALAAVAWFAMALIFIRHDLFSAVLLLLVALICIPSLRASLRQATGIRIPGAATGVAIVALVCTSLVSAGRSMEERQSRGQSASIADTTAEPAVTVSTRSVSRWRLRPPIHP
jgi:hypothetical protein